MTTNYTRISRSTDFLKLFFFAMFALLFANNSSASHFAGSNITYQHLGGNSYKLNIAYYRDCYGISAPTQVTIYIASSACGVTQQAFTATPIPGTGQEITYPCPGSSTTCSGGSAPGIQKWEYSVTIALPAQCPDWRFWTQDCCRNAAITTLQNGGGSNIYIEARLNNTIYDNNSPYFTVDPIVFVCTNQNFYFNNGTIDADGDSLVYSFIAPRVGENTNVTYNPGYSIIKPISSTPNVSINPVFGDIFMRPTAIEVGVMAVLVQEYRNGVLIGSVMRDIQVYTQTCNNTTPTATGINGGGTFSTSGCGGTQICFDILSFDPDPNQVLTMTWSNTIPGATFTTSGSPHPTGHFCWQTTPADIRSQPYTFTVTVRDNNCPANGVQVYSYSIYVGGGLQATVQSTNVTCNGANDGTATVNVTGASTPPYTYAWSPGGMTTQSVSGLAPGLYSVVVSDAVGCNSTYNANITQPSAVSASVSNVVHATCGQPGSFTIVGSGGVGNYSYSANTNPVQNTANVTNVSPGTYTVTVTDGNGCAASNTVTINGSNNIQLSTSSSPDSCSRNIGSASVVASNGTGGYSYLWSPGGSTNATATGLGAGTYSVMVTDGAGCQATASVVVGNVGITASIVSSSDATCSNGDDGSATALGSGGQAPYTYLWSPVGGTNASATGLSPGTYTVRVEDYLGCVAFANVTIGYMHMAPMVDLGPDTTLCNGSSLTLDAGAGFASYLWSDNSTGQTLTVSSAGMYGVVVTDNNGCQNSDVISVSYIQCQVNPQVHQNSRTFSSLSIYPNPATNLIEIAILNTNKSDVSIEIHDILGNIVLSTVEHSGYNYNGTLDISTMPAGIYMVKARVQDQAHSIRLIKK